MSQHESLVSQFKTLMRRKIPKNITYLEDAQAVIECRKFWGSPRTLGFDWMAFTHRAVDRPEHIWAAIPDETDVLVTHGPPLGILDRGLNGQLLGDIALMKRIEVVRPRLHLFGHVHDQNGEGERDGIRYVDAAIVMTMRIRT